MERTHVARSIQPLKVSQEWSRPHDATHKKRKKMAGATIRFSGSLPIRTFKGSRGSHSDWEAVLAFFVGCLEVFGFVGKNLGKAKNTSEQTVVCCVVLASSLFGAYILY